MASLRYHAGRMVLYEEEPTVWRVKIKTKQGKLNLPLKAKELDGLGCDHDLETNQWLLFQKGINSQPAQVIERYRY